VQHKENGIQRERAVLARVLDQASHETTNCTVVFFAAGTAPGRDSFAEYHKLASLMKQPTIVYEAENAWKVVAVISQAGAVLSTSLHVRIMAFVFFKPRATWCTKGKQKKSIELERSAIEINSV
jgi:hypothetical protein